MALQIKVFDQNLRSAWNEFVAGHPFGSPLQYWEWGEVKRSAVWRPIRLGIFDNHQLVGAAQILRRQLPMGFFLLYCPRGPVISWNDDKSIEILSTLLKSVKQDYTSWRTLFFRLEPPIINNQPRTGIDAVQDKQSTISNQQLFPYFKSIQPSHTAIVDLTAAKEEILYRMDKDTRYGIRRGAREGVRVVKDGGSSLGLWKQFYKMYKETAQGVFVHRPWRQFEKIFKLMAPRGQAELFLSFLPPHPSGQKSHLPFVITGNLPEGARLIAGAVILKTKLRGYYLWGASKITPEIKNLFGAYILQWEIMQSLKEEGVKSYDLWGVAPNDDPKHSWSGHTLFKKGFGGKRINYLGCLDLPLSPLYRLYLAADYARQKLLKPDLIE